MKKQLLLIALMAVTTFSAQAAAGFALKAGLAAAAAGTGYITGTLTYQVVHSQTTALLEEIASRTFALGVKETVVPAIRNSSFARKAVVAGTLAAAAYYGIKARRQAKKDALLQLPTHIERTPQSFAVELTGINGTDILNNTVDYGTPPIDGYYAVEIKSLGEELHALDQLAKKNK